MNENILLLNQILDFEAYRRKLITKIEFLSFETLNEDYVKELVKNLGMIKETLI